MSLALLRKSVGLFLGLAGLTIGLTWLFLGSRAVMSMGGSCGSGGPYVVAKPCPDGIPLVVLGGIFGGLIGLALYAWSSLPVGPRLLVLAWPALFLSLGWNFAEFGFAEPGADGIGFIVCAVVFFLMGGFPLLALRDPRALRHTFWSDGPAPSAFATPRRLAARVGGHAPRGSGAELFEGADLVDSAADSLIAALERLTALRERGALTEEEYAIAKARVLGDH